MNDPRATPNPDSAGIPPPAHPERRREPLPWQTPKPPEEDPGAAERIEAIVKSRAYREADEDIDFLRRPETRGVRLQLDYVKAEVLLEEAGIEHTVVVFGSTRICEPAAARRAADALAGALAADAGNAELRRRLEVAQRIVANSRYYEIAREFGRLVGTAASDGPRRRIVVMTGGGPGIMEAANRGAHDAGADSIGLNITLPDEQYPNPYVSPDLCFRFHYFANRKLHFMLRARALVAFPGGFGTLDEVFELLTLVQTRKMVPVPIVMVGEAYWRKVLDLDFLVGEGTIDPEDRELFWFAETAEDIWHGILHWYEAAGRPLLPKSAAQET
ncbi:MAG TPA: TIGR00730 family Rossman fold protein [Stellaceae bacterium]|nr:TIGR00730 family Rossman fold protein [Stellaceae bacterium]